MSALEALPVVIEAIGIAGVVAVSYASTNVDNLVILSAYCAKSGYRPLFVKLTFVLVSLIVLLVSLGAAQAVDALLADKLRYLGALPIGLGLDSLAKLAFPPTTEDARLDEFPASAAWSIYLGLALTLLANSSDSMIVLAPVLGDLRPAFVFACVLAAAAVALGMSSLASLVGGNPLLRAQFEKLADWLLPFLLIGIGVMIIADIPSGALLGLAEPGASIAQAPPSPGKPALPAARTSIRRS